MIGIASNCEMLAVLFIVCCVVSVILGVKSYGTRFVFKKQTKAATMNYQSFDSWGKNLASAVVFTSLIGNPILASPSFAATASEPQSKQAPAATPAPTTTKPLPAQLKPAAPTQPPKPKLSEEIAVETAIAKKAANKDKIDSLNVEISAAKVSMSAARTEIKRLESEIESLDQKLKNSKLDKDLRKSIGEDKDSLKKPLNLVMFLHELPRSIHD